MTDKLARLEEVLRQNAPLVVAYSGGVDSSCLLALAQRTLGDKVLGVIADSPSLPRKALAEALDQARSFGARVEVIATQEFENSAYLENPVNRCYFCKAELFSRMDELARERKFSAIAYGENADDPAHLRPGSAAAKEFSVVAPLREAGLTKADVRAVSRLLGLVTAEAPAQPCLSSRIPHGTPVTREALAMVEQGEDFLRSLGFRIVRVRYVAGPPVGALVQLGPQEVLAGMSRTQEIADGLRASGFGEVTIDPKGYQGVPV